MKAIIHEEEEQESPEVEEPDVCNSMTVIYTESGECLTSMETELCTVADTSGDPTFWKEVL